MAITFLGAGTYAAGNNAAVTPGLPAGLVSGDFLVLIVTIRENVGTSIATPAGWTSLYNAASATRKITGGIFYRDWTAGVTAPTVTPAGGGANDTTQALILGYRGVATSGTQILLDSYNVDGTADAWPFGSILGRAVFRGSYAAEDHLLHFYISGFTQAANATPGSTNGPAAQEYYASGSTYVNIPYTTGYSTTALGSDASLAWSTARATRSYQASPIIQIEVAAGATSATEAGGKAVIIKAAPTGNIYTPFTSGGVKIGGTAGVIQPARYTPTTSGGIKIGGTAGITYLPQGGVAGSGGIKIGGTATYLYVPVSIYNMTGSGGIKAGGTASSAYQAATTFYVSGQISGLLDLQELRSNVYSNIIVDYYKKTTTKYSLNVINSSGTKTVVPLVSWNCTLYLSGKSYASCLAAISSADLDAVLDATEFEILSYEEFENGFSWSKTVFRLPIEQISTTNSSDSFLCSIISDYFDLNYSSSTSNRFYPRKIRSIAISNINTTVNCELDAFAQPGMIVALESRNLYFVAQTIVHQADVYDSSMILSGA